MSLSNATNELLDRVTAGQFPDVQIERLRSCVLEALQHPWVDEELCKSIADNIARMYAVDLPEYFEGEANDK